MKDKGVFVISLDFELFWGVRDKRSIENYGDTLKETHLVVPRMLQMFNKYKVSSTFATVGFLFADTKEEILRHNPNIQPKYKDPNLSPYTDNFVQVKDKSSNDPFHYAPELISILKKDSNHEIATHTYSHFYCQEEGQTAADFEADLKAAISIATDKGIKLDSLAFPRNQFSREYLKICKNNNILTYRGNENVWFCRPESEENTTIYKRIARTLDCYVNISGKHCYKLSDLKKEEPYNIPSSRFLRPYSNKLKRLESLKIRRVKKAMKHAAKNGLLYHLWWHPHNFGANTEENFKTLEEILKYYEFLNKKYGFESKTMKDTGEMIGSNNNFN
ncbi:MAG: DUF2334 domain-containing protein [Cellulophaga sp.]|uniref:polysaccharide deacetylase family protein n=1 Tax=unclassified Cellulophaga TaxID=2634405 RepID=UPI0026E17CBC|nr:MULTISPECIES: DUF2334 domain-containing protein [unclassified Cellulophaga]MDO6491468.1 DUF2334 domain-containing protein [Cellulophaga sp. 2_MG-2023]MDO6493345.1 DUF2334 domain-containing protein [Cellulophaga sp. 3_MG-2023]